MKCEKGASMRVWFYYGLLVLQIIFLMYIHTEGRNGMHSVQALHTEVQELAQSVTTCKNDIECLNNEIVAWNMQPFYKEQFAREHLHMARKDDIVYCR